MISYDMILTELEKYTAQAKRTDAINEKREAISAIRALCDVALQTEAPEKATYTAPAKSIMVASENQQAIPVSVPSQSNKLYEEDANGDSLFDF